MQERPIIIKQVTNDDLQEQIKQRLKEFSDTYCKKLRKKAYPAIYNQ